MDIWTKLKYTFKTGSALTRLIYVNAGVYIAYLLLRLIFMLFDLQIDNPIISYGAIPSDFEALAQKPWTAFSYMFVHQDFFHILFNLLWLYWMGQIFLSYLDGKKLLSVYLLGGISGALFYVLAYNTFPAFKNISGLAIGASASVYAITFAIAYLVPNYTLRLFLFGPVKLKYLAVIPLVIDILSIPAGNAGGKIAHLGGAAFGLLFSIQYSKGKDFTGWFQKLINSIQKLFKPKSNLKVTYSKKTSTIEQAYRDQKAYNQKEVDRILDKIAKSGYKSLTKEEKETLFKMSQKN